MRIPTLPAPVRVALIIVGIGLIPYWAWWACRSTELAVLVIDKTVATETYREHRGFMWALNHFKIKPKDGQAPFRYDQDYVGFVPRPDKKLEVRPLPIAPKAYDMVYFTDTYGVYEADYYAKNVHGVHSKLLYGGLDAQDITTARADLAPNGTFIGEFNMFASPTRAAGRKAATDLLGLTWNGWIGRYFEDLTRDREVPTWLVSDYERQKNRKYEFKGPGFAYVNDDDRVEVLRIPQEVNPGGLTIHFKDPDHYGVKDNTRYDYWYDCVAPKAGTTVEATYHLDATLDGEKLLLAAGIPIDCAAVLRRRITGATCYYFAGDYADYEEVPDRWRVWGLGWISALLTPNDPTHPEAFFWRVYVPMLRTVLQETAEARGASLGNNTH